MYMLSAILIAGTPGMTQPGLPFPFQHLPGQDRKCTHLCVGFHWCEKYLDVCVYVCVCVCLVSVMFWFGVDVRSIQI